MLVGGKSFFHTGKARGKDVINQISGLGATYRIILFFCLFKWIRKSYQKMQIFTKLELELPMQVVALS